MRKLKVLKGTVVLEVYVKADCYAVEETKREEEEKENKNVKNEKEDEEEEEEETKKDKGEKEEVEWFVKEVGSVSIASVMLRVL